MRAQLDLNCCSSSLAVGCGPSAVPPSKPYSILQADVYVHVRSPAARREIAEGFGRLSEVISAESVIVEGQMASDGVIVHCRRFAVQLVSDWP